MTSSATIELTYASLYQHNQSDPKVVAGMPPTYLTAAVQDVVSTCPMIRL